MYIESQVEDIYKETWCKKLRKSVRTEQKYTHTVLPFGQLLIGFFRVMPRHQQCHAQWWVWQEVGGVKTVKGTQGGFSEEGAGVGEVARQEREDLRREGLERVNERHKRSNTQFLEK